MTEEQLALLPRGRARHELVHGRLRVLPLCDCMHGSTGANFSWLGGTWARGRTDGEMLLREGYVLDTDHVLGPDGPFATKQQIEASKDREPDYLPGAPPFVVEIINFDETHEQLAERIEAEWLARGTRLAWLANTRDQIVEVFHDSKRKILTACEKLDGYRILPGFSALVSDLLPEEATG